MRRKGGDGLLGLLSAVMLLLPLALQASEPKTNYQVEYVQERMTIKAEKVTLGHLLDTIREKTGVEFIFGREQSERQLTVRLESLPLDESLKRFLSDFSYTFFYGPGDRLGKVFILDKSDSTGRLPLSGSVKNDAAERPERQVNQDQDPSFAGDRVVIEPPGRERADFTSSEEEEMVLEPAMVDNMIVTPSAEKMVISPPVEKGMVINSPIAPMHIEYQSEVNMPIRGYEGGANFHFPK